MLVGRRDEKNVSAIEKLIGQPIARRAMEGLPEEEPRPEHTRDRHRSERGQRNSAGRGRGRKNGNGYDSPAAVMHANGTALAPSPVLASPQMPVEAKPAPRPQAVKAHEPRQQRPTRNGSGPEKPNGKPNGQESRPVKANGHDASQLPAFILRPVRLPPKTAKTP